MTTDRHTLPPLVGQAEAHVAHADVDLPEERTADATWIRPAFWGLLVATAILYMWGLGASGWANDFYSAAAQAGSQSWKALFFGASDAANSITVDKPPLSLWAMALSVRIFGLSSWSILIPQALMGVASVGVLYATVRRWFGAPAGLLAGAVLALTPVATLMFRFNNPDALLVLLLVVAAYALVRALETGSVRWMVGVGTAIGFGFLTKMLQALIVVPGFAIVYLIAAPVVLSARVRHVLAAGLAMVLSAGWWVAIVELTPASMRPYVGGSQNNSVLELIFGYNGFGRLTGNETGSVGGGRPGGAMWGTPSWHRMFDASWAGQIAWLIPAALVGFVVLMVMRRGAPRTDRIRAGAMVWGGWLVVTQIVFSFGKGIIHEYYAVALAPAIAALVGMAGVQLWNARRAIAARVVMAGTVFGSALYARSILDNAADWHPALQSGVVMLGLVAAGLLLAGDSWHRTPVIAGTAALAALLLAPAAYSLQTASVPHTGAIPTAGPRSVGFGPGGMGGPRGAGMQGRFAPPGGMPTGQLTPPAGQFGGPGGGGGAGGLLSGSRPSDEVVAALRDNADAYTWVAATVGANQAAGYQLATELPVMAIGGFNGSDPAPTLAEFKALVQAGKIHWFIGGGGQMSWSVGGDGGGFGNQMGGSQAASQIAEWVSSTFTATTVGNVTMYDLTGAA